ncbi:MAG: choice-of-anchor Q domain-containing protein [Chloroflexota bacterium]
MSIKKSLRISLATSLLSLLLLSLTIAAFADGSQDRLVAGAEQIDCGTSSWAVATESDLNGAIDCFNSKSVSGTYTISLTQSISLTNDTFLHNPTIGVKLNILGNKHSFFGHDKWGGTPFRVYEDTDVSVSNLSVILGRSMREDGGGILNSGTLTLTDSIISGGRAKRGGGIFNTGSLSVIDSRIVRGFAGLGGGIFNSGSLTVTRSMIYGNYGGFGGAIYDGGIDDVHYIDHGPICVEMSNVGGEVKIFDSVITGNDSGCGGGVYAKGILNVVDSSIRSNFADGWGKGGGGIYSVGELEIIRSTISDNWISWKGDGGGIYFAGSAMTVDSSTISGNRAVGVGGGIYSSGNSMTLQNSTVSDNSAYIDVEAGYEGDVSGSGGGILSNGALELIHSTVSENLAMRLGGGILGGPLTLTNSIIANSRKGGDCISRNVNFNGINLVEDNGCGFTGGRDPKLGRLKNNGGPTLTHALMDCSPAIDAAGSSLATDQRGVARPEGSAADIGAFEYQPDRPFPCPVIQSIFLPNISSVP